VAELYNTTTNFAYVLAALLALRRCARLQLSFTSWLFGFCLLMTVSLLSTALPPHLLFVLPIGRFDSISVSPPHVLR
jgi:hypothetical protein